MIKSAVWLSIILGLTVGVSFADASDRLYYRYTNDEGVQVLEDRIPPRYVAQGYEVVSLNGRVIRTVPPAPSEEELKQQAQEQRTREEREQYHRELKRRFSSAMDIRDAKRRNLAELQGNISILESNLSGVRLRIRDLQSRAATRERSGQEVGEAVLENLATLQTEVMELQAQIRQREQEYKQVEEKFNLDIQRFKAMQEETASR